MVAIIIAADDNCCAVLAVSNCLHPTTLSLLIVINAQGLKQKTHFMCQTVWHWHWEKGGAVWNEASGKTSWRRGPDRGLEAEEGQWVRIVMWVRAARESACCGVGRMHRAAEAGALHSHGQAVTLDVVMSLPPCSTSPLLAVSCWPHFRAYLQHLLMSSLLPPHPVNKIVIRRTADVHGAFSGW